jgi:hypothetical protein
MAFFNPVRYFVERPAAYTLERRAGSKPVQAVSD